METNQLAPQMLPPRESTAYLPIRIAYVHAVGADLRDPFIQKFRDFCHEHKVHFTTRVYSPVTYSDDRDYIERLPALQLNEGKHNHRTFYPDTRPYQIVEEAVLHYQTRQRNKLEANGAWKKRMSSLQESLSNLFRKKTRMEQVEEERKAQEAKRKTEIPVGKIVYEPVPPKKPLAKPKLFGSLN